MAWKHQKFNKSRWLVRSLFLTSIVLGALPRPLLASEQPIESLPFCDNTDDGELPGSAGSSGAPIADRHLGKRLIYVTTLDGRVAALDMTNGGEQRWDVATGPGELLSSSIQNLELTNKGQVVRIIPSLSGSLYQLTGQSVEAIPITAENLLSLSFKFSDDLVISGGKDTRSYGVSARTGKVIYECTMAGCKNESMANAGTEQKHSKKSKNIDPMELQEQQKEDLSGHHDYYMDDVVVIRRQTQTVRAIDPRTGVERWNFSVGNHELDILTRDDCHQNNNENNNFVDLSDIDLRVVVPEGLICAYSKSTAALLWQKKFDFPIVDAWRMNSDGKLGKVDLFSSVQWMYDHREEDGGQNTARRMNPSIYVGLFGKQMYVQESDAMRRKYQEYLANQNNINNNKDVATAGGPGGGGTGLSLPWRPVPAIKTDLMALAMEQGEYSEEELLDKFALMTINNPVSAWHASKGFYIVDEEMTPAVECKEGDEGNNDSKVNHNNSSGIEGGDGEDSVTNMVTLRSIWYYWKEIVVISLTSALVLNLFLNNSARLRQEREFKDAQPVVRKEIVNVERYIEIPIPMEKTNTLSTSDQSKGSAELSVVTGNPNFESRFLADFDMIQCLGKGGFGVVFEAKNKLDDCRYAVKRIVLPGRKENRDRVMREVKTLANCEHQNIVRFFQAWVEQPPPGWQEDQDRFWLSHQDSIMSTSIDIESTMEGVTDGGIYNERLAVSPRRGVYAELNTDECLNLDEELVRKTSFMQKTSTKSGRRKFRDNDVDEEEEEDSFIEFRYSTNNNNDDIERNDNYEDSSSSSEEASSDDNNDTDSDSGTSPHHHPTNKHSCSSNTDSVFNNKEQLHSSDNHNDNRVMKKQKHRNYSLDQTENQDNNKNTRMYLYIQMQLCQKQSLKEWLQLTPHAERTHKIVPIFDQITRAVEYVHLKGLIHRDLKPSNIFFALDGTVKVGDFGLVTDMEEGGPEEAVEAIEGDMGDGHWQEMKQRKKHTQQVGTHLYMSPEQLNGGQYDYKVDIYSLGLILFELLVVFSTEMERIKALTSLRQNNFPVEYLAAYEKEWELLKKMLSKRPQERPTTFGIRASPPLNQREEECVEYHYELPSRRKDSRSVS